MSAHVVCALVAAFALAPCDCDETEGPRGVRRNSEPVQPTDTDQTSGLSTSDYPPGGGAVSRDAAP